MSCIPARRRVHVAGSWPLAACTDNRTWSGPETDISAWSCSDPDRTVFIAFADELFAPPPGVERLAKACCPPVEVSDACDGWDGGLREAVAEP
jgi:hypothetical protein